MQIIKKLSEMIEDEVCGAIEYAKNAVLYKDDEKELGNMFHDLAEAELGHVNRLHEMVSEYVKKAKESGMIIPTGMTELYEYLHERQIEKVNEAKNYLGQFQE